jgi:DNA repair exonuclease SbcCD ATPase subunit
MTEVGQQWDQAEDNNLDERVEGMGPRHDAPFVALTHALYQENERLVELAEACRDHAEQLVEREARLAEREQRVSEADEAHGHRVADLDQREQHVSELAGRADEVNARLAEAAEREAALAALGVQLAERYRAE